MAVCPMDPMAIYILPMTCIGHIPTTRCEIAEVLSFDPLGAYCQGLSYPHHEGFTTHGQRSWGAGLSPPQSRWLEDVEVMVTQHLFKRFLGGGFNYFLCSPRKLGKMNPF